MKILQKAGVDFGIFGKKRDSAAAGAPATWATATSYHAEPTAI